MLDRSLEFHFLGRVRDAAADDVVLRKRLLKITKRFATTIGVDIVG